MKAQITNTWTMSARMFQRGIVGLAVLLVLAVAGGGVALAWRSSVTTLPAAIPVLNVGVLAPLDLYDRHTSANAGVSTFLDAH